MNRDYLTPTMGLKLISPVMGGMDTSNDYWIIQCRLCPHKFEATPKSKKQNFNRHGRAGCPKCTDIARYQEARADMMRRLEEIGIELLEDYTMNKKETRMKNISCCGREFSARVDNVLNGLTICPPCNTERKRKAFQDFNIERHEESLQYKEPFEAYQKVVRVLSEQNYRKHKDTINPDNLPRGRNHDYHLDHIRSISECFHAGVPPEECAHYTNLQMLPWDENISKGGNNRL